MKLIARIKAALTADVSKIIADLKSRVETIESNVEQIEAEVKAKITADLATIRKDI
jgi:hypothetical protein